MKHFGYAGKILYVDLSWMYTVDLPIEEYADRFIGGRGFAAKLYWDKVSPQARAFDPDNCIIFTTGPLAGFTRIGGSRWQICGKSPSMVPQYFSYANIGGNWGPGLNSQVMTRSRFKAVQKNRSISLYMMASLK